jgi:hypothetical protein
MRNLRMSAPFWMRGDFELTNFEKTYGLGRPQ